jgi:hypothetical protein
MYYRNCRLTDDNSARNDVNDLNCIKVLARRQWPDAGVAQDEEPELRGAMN